MTGPDLRERYRQALGAWLERDDAGQDADPLGLGREALAGGRGLIDLLSIHQSLVAAFVARLPSQAEVARYHARADSFLTEMAGPYEMTHRGWRDVMERLQRLNATLERQVAERTSELASSELRFRDIAEVSADWISDSDREHRFTNFIGASLAELSMTPATYIGKTRWEVVGADPRTDAHWAGHRAELDAHLTFRNFRYAVASGTGGQIHISVSGKPVFDGKGAFVGYRGTATNETRMIEAVHRAEQADVLLRDAIGSMSGGFVICDADDRILLSNQHVRRVYPDCIDTLKPGTAFEAFTRDTVAKGYYPEAAGQEEEFIAERMVAHRAGAGWTEYRVKGGHWSLIHERRMSNGGVVSIGVDISELKAAQCALAASEERLDRAQEIAHIGSWDEDIATGAVFWSHEMCRIRGVAPGAVRTIPDAVERRIEPEDAPEVSAWFADLRRGIAREPIEVRLRRPAGEPHIVRYDGRPVADASGRIIRIAGTLQDVTRRKLAERRLVQAQKMEAIGNLTGGIAHDFNNLIGVIVGNLDLLRDLTKDAPEIDELAKESLDAALRGADLTRRLLAFARRQPLHPRRGDVNDLIASTIHLLRRTLGETIECALDLAPDLWPVAVDPSQLGAAFTNLATNARDAMPKGGRIAVATRNGHLDEDYAKRHLDVTPGDYVVIAFSDSGAGMSAAVASRIFEPFFTTKEPGKGTGLGLAMVFGFMRQSGGHIDVYSEPGVGTTFRLYLPRDTSEAEQPLRATPVAIASVKSGETILVVEDNEKLLAVVVKQLTELGYRVLSADGAPAALRILEQPEPIELLLTDIVMPGGMNGIELARSAVAMRPQLKVLLTSGFPQARIGENGVEVSGRSLLSKPYRRDELAQQVRKTLDERAAAPSVRGAP